LTGEILVPKPVIYVINYSKIMPFYLTHDSPSTIRERIWVTFVWYSASYKQWST